MTGSDGAIRSQLEAFLVAQLGADAEPRVDRLTRVATGRSRENWMFDATWRSAEGPVRESLIVRRDPLGGLLETDRTVEFNVLRALASTGVPAPQPRWLDADGASLGRPSLVMVREQGDCEYFVLNGERPLADRLELARHHCALLASVHAVDWRAAGMGEFLADPGPFAAVAELDRWESILRRDQLESYPELELAAHWMRNHAPQTAHTALVHGDFKPGNVLLDGNRIVALLDWELAHLGDPHEDLGWVTQPLRRKEHAIAGHWERDDLLDHYGAITGFEPDPAAVTWWNALATYKTAVMQVSGLRSYVEGRCDERYQPTAAVLRTLTDVMES